MPREKAIEFGINSLTNNELLALVIKSAYKDKTVFDLANEVINTANGFKNILSLTYEELTNIKGIKNAKALEILAILEIARRLSSIEEVNEDSLSNPSKIVNWIRFNIGFCHCEEFFVIYINSRGKVIKSEVLFKGSKNASTVGVDEILRKAILLKSSCLVIAHNHPGDDCKPSNADLEITRRIKQSCILLDINFLDHIIISKSSYYSFKANGLC